MILGPQFGAHYRTVAEHDMVELLLLAGFAGTADAATATAQSSDALNRWIVNGLEVHVDAAGARRFDPVEVFTFFKRAGLKRRDDFWADHFVASARRLVGTFAEPTGRTYAVTLRRTFTTDGLPAGKPLRLRAPLPLTSVHGPLADLVIFAEGATQAQLRVSEGRLEARCVTVGEPAITLAANFTLQAAYDSSSGLETHAPADHLKTTEDLIVVSPAVRELARRLSGEQRPGANVVRRFWNHLLENFVCGPVHYDQIDPAASCDWVLRAGHYDCRLGAALFIALCRAVEIPARLVSGHFLYAAAPTNHSWAEVWLDDHGWLPFDFLAWDLSHGGRDATWRERFYGRIEPRLVMQRLPYEFTGNIGVALPAAWHMLQRTCDRGVSISFDGLDRRPIFRDAISVTMTPSTRESG